MTGIRRLLAAGNIVGESAVWCDRQHRLLWVDIVGRTIQALDPRTGALQRWSTPGLVTSIGLRAGGGAIVGLERTVALWSFGGAFDTIATVEPDVAGNRLNEGRVGPDGAFWVGTMQNNIGASGEPLSITRRSGAIHRIDPAGRVETLTPHEFGICNTMIWRPGELICADTLANGLFVYDRQGSTLGARRPWGETIERGLPDGSAADRDGGVWTCRVGVGAIVRYAADGRVDQVIDLPCAAPTSCCFGGEDLATLFVTSARFGLEASRATDPDQGAVFALDVGRRGFPEHRFGEAGQ